MWKLRSAAEAANAIAEDEPETTHWLPGLIPGSATDIKERHSCDTSEIWVTFSFAENDLPVLLVKGTPVTTIVQTIFQKE